MNDSSGRLQVLDQRLQGLATVADPRFLSQRQFGCAGTQLRIKE
jgi:hypothetical protein